MTSTNQDLHGNAPDKAEAALLLIDVINDLEFPEGDQLLRHALPMAERLVNLKRRARDAGIPVDLRQRQLRPLALRLQRPGRALPEGRRARPGHRAAAEAGAGRLLRPQAEALGLLLDDARHPAGIPGRQDDHPDGHRRQHLRAVHGQRRLHARLRPGRALPTAWRRTPRTTIATPWSRCARSSRPTSALHGARPAGAPQAREEVRPSGAGAGPAEDRYFDGSARGLAGFGSFGCGA